MWVHLTITKKNTIISSRYEQFDLNDLVEGKSQRIYGSLAYQIDGFNSMIKFQYWHILSEEENDPLEEETKNLLSFQ